MLRRAAKAIVQVTGKVKVFTKGKSSRLFFETPEQGARWGIEVTLRPAQMKEVKADQTVTVRGRFAPRKPSDGNVTMSNCTLLEVR